MQRSLIDPVIGWTRSRPIESHIAHLRHLTSPTGLQRILHERHGYPSDYARKEAPRIAAFVTQALEFQDAQRSVSPRVQPVLQYYAYLNFAVAVILTWRPNSWQDYTHHGAQDLTHRLLALKARSAVVRIRKGAIRLFHSILSDAVLPTRDLTLQELLVPIPWASYELEQVLKIRPQILHVGEAVDIVQIDNEAKYVSTFQFIHSDPQHKAGSARAPFPIKRLNATIPALRNEYTQVSASPGRRNFVSKRRWSASDKAQCVAFHEALALKATNYGGHGVEANAKPSRKLGFFGSVEPRVEWSWRLTPVTPLLTTATASLLLAFVLASISRYRPNLLGSVEASRESLLLQTFQLEVSDVLVPLFRNLLYREHLHLLIVP